MTLSCTVLTRVSAPPHFGLNFAKCPPQIFCQHERNIVVTVASCNEGKLVVGENRIRTTLFVTFHVQDPQKCKCTHIYVEN